MCFSLCVECHSSLYVWLALHLKHWASVRPFPATPLKSGLPCQSLSENSTEYQHWWSSADGRAGVSLITPKLSSMQTTFMILHFLWGERSSFSLTEWALCSGFFQAGVIHWLSCGHLRVQMEEDPLQAHLQGCWQLGPHRLWGANINCSPQEPLTGDTLNPGLPLEWGQRERLRGLISKTKVIFSPLGSSFPSLLSRPILYLDVYP
jgi:hypothetical protein